MMLSQKVINLKIETKTNPEGIETKSPKFSWKLEDEKRNSQQSAYQILVATSLKLLKEGKTDIWNSGRIVSQHSVNVPFSGKSLQSGKQYFWKVKVWTNHGETSWSYPASWGMGLLQKEDWQAQWIGWNHLSPGDTIAQHPRLSARYLRKEFGISEKIKKATVYISGLGMYELFINGKKVGNQVLAPGVTNYKKNVLYNTFDVTELIAKGENAVGVTLGNGRFFPIRQGIDFQKSQDNFPKMIFQMEIELKNGKKVKIISDDSWKITADGPIRANNEYDGEEYDARKELGNWTKANYNDTKWNKPHILPAPAELLVAQQNENMMVHERIQPVSVNKLQQGKYILDFGQNLAGWLKIKILGKKGNVVKMRFAESLNPDGTLYTENLRTAQQTDIYTMKGEGIEVWNPSFVYHGFRFVEISGLSETPKAENFTAEVIYDGFPTVGNFKTSNSLLNQIYHNAYWGYQSNFKGMPIDCPQRDEREPWLGDWATTSIGASYSFDIQRLFVKWMDDIRFEMGDDGRLPDVAPVVVWSPYTNNMTWPGTYILVADMLYNRFGNQYVVRKHYPDMKKWLWFMKDKYLKENIMTRDRYGDWCVPPESKELIHSKDPAKNTDGQLIATAYFYYFLNRMTEFAEISGNPKDISEFQNLAKEVKTAFNAKFYNTEKYQYDNNTVTANLLPLAFGLVNPSDQNQVFNQMIIRIENQDALHLSTGLIGTQWLMRELTKRSRGDIAFTIATQKTYPSWGYMIENGATTVWELWNGNTANPSMNSQNHVMLLGDLVAWMYEDVAGIKTQCDMNGNYRIIMKPSLSKQLSFAEASTEIPYGKVSSSWKVQNDIFSWEIQIPENTEAQVYIPANSLKNITESGKPVSSTNGIEVKGLENGFLHVVIGSGKYQFQSK